MAENRITELIKGLQDAEKTMKEQNVVDAGVDKGYTRVGPESITLGDVDALNRTDNIPDQKAANTQVANVIKKK